MKSLTQYWMNLCTAAATLRYSLAVICRAYTGQLTRASVDSIILRWSQRLLRITKTQYTVHNPHDFSLTPGQRVIFMSNHASHYDIPLLIVSLPGSLRMVAKQELFRIPFFGQAMHKAEFIPLNREDKEEAKRNLELAQEKMASGIGIWIAPEGTRSRTGALGPFKKGGFMMAFQTDAVIVPVTIKGSAAILSPTDKRIHQYQHVDVYIGKPLCVKSYGIRQRQQLMDDVADQIQTYL